MSDHSGTANFASRMPMDQAKGGNKGWMARLGERWGVAPSRVLVILLVFACTGFTVMFLKKPIVAWVTGEGDAPLIFSVLYYVLILPLYNVVLLIYGALFGQFSFFWAFEKRFFGRLFGKRKASGQ
jgi:hypothetical protein